MASVYPLNGGFALSIDDKRFRSAFFTGIGETRTMVCSRGLMILALAFTQRISPLWINRNFLLKNRRSFNQSNPFGFDAFTALRVNQCDPIGDRSRLGRHEEQCLHRGSRLPTAPGPARLRRGGACVQVRQDTESCLCSCRCFCDFLDG